MFPLFIFHEELYDDVTNIIDLHLAFLYPGGVVSMRRGLRLFLDSLEHCQSPFDKRCLDNHFHACNSDML